MIVLSVLTGACAAASVVLGVLLWRCRTSSPLEKRMRRRIIVTLKSGETFAGLLFEADATALVLREAVAIEAAAQGHNVVVDGEALLLLPDVAYVQFP